MLAACALLAIATVSGCLLTFLYDRTSPFPARLCMGAASGMVLFAAAGYLYALWMGLSATTMVLAIGTILLPFLLLLQRDFRETAIGTTRAAIQTAAQAARRSDRWTVGCVFFYCALTVLLSAVFASAAYRTPLGIFTGVRNNLGDLPLHLQIINSFAQGQNVPPEDPTFAGVRFAYPFMVDFLAAMLIRSGAGIGIIHAMWAENMFAALTLVGMLHYWTLLLTRNRAAGLIAPLLVLFSGGLGWAWLFQDLHESPHGLIPLLGSLPHSYTIMDAPGILRWGNSLTTLFVPQRSILFGMPLAILIFCQWWLAVTGGQTEPSSTTQETRTSAARRMVAAGIFAGLMPLVHAHTFVVVMMVGACLPLLFWSAWRQWLVFFATALVVAPPELFWLANSGGVKLRSYLGWQLGWDHAQFNPVLFWLTNTGLFTPLLLLALLSRRPGVSLPRPVLKFYAPFLLCFIVPNLFRVAPWVWDNIKVLFWWYVASAPLVAWLLAEGLSLRQRRGLRWMAAGALATLLLAGALDVLAVVTSTSEYQEFDPDGMAMAKIISDHAAPRAVVLHAPVYNSPVLLTGRRSLMGYAGWMWSRGLDDAQRQSEIRSMYSGDAGAEALLRRYQVEYVLIGPAELTSLNVNPQFWSRYARVAQVGPYLLYRIGATAERATP